MQRPKVVAVDFDDTVARLSHKRDPYKPKEVIKQDPIWTMIYALRNLKTYFGRDIKIIVFSSRWWGDYNVVVEWLKRWGVPFDDVVLGALKADLYVNDLSRTPKAFVAQYTVIRNSLEDGLSLQEIAN